MSEMDDQNEQQRAKEDGPEYRSVVIQSSAFPKMRRSFSPLEKVNKSYAVSDQSCSNNGGECTTPFSSTSRWEHQELPNLPIDYHLVRTNVYVKDSSAQLVADRICNALKILSIVIDSKGFEEEKNSLLVETQHGTKMVISLFGHNDMIVVEVRRQAGCSIQFRDAAKAILRFSKGLGKQQRSLSTRKFCIPPTLPTRSRETYQECIRNDFQTAYAMLRSKKADAHLLALDNMRIMTTISDADDVAAKLILSNCDCLKQLLFLLDSYTKDRYIPGIGLCYHSALCRKILEILANSCEAIRKNDLAGILSTNEHHLKTRSFLSFLVSSLLEASIRPHDAFQAARCLRSLLISKEVESLLVEMSAIDAISSALSVGLNFHKELEQESFKLMGQLQNVC